MPSAYTEMTPLLSYVYGIRRFHQRLKVKIVSALLLLFIIDFTVHLLSPIQPLARSARSTNTHRHGVTQRQVNSSTSRHRTSSSEKTATRTNLRRSFTGESAVRTRLTADHRPSARRSPRLQRCKESVQRPRTPSAELQQWQEVAGRNVTVFSAYVDRRVDAGGPLIRIIASGLQEAYNSVGQLYCRMWFVDTKASAVTGQTTYEQIFRSPNPAMWAAHFVLCPLADSASPEVPQLVSVLDRPCGTPANVLLVLDRDRVGGTTNRNFIGRSGHRKRRKTSFALCLPALYGW